METRPANKDYRALPDRLADEMIVRIYLGEWPAGAMLPSERALAEQLGVDRTSLRLALRQLGRMNLIQAVRGSGIRVRDYREHGGIEVLAAVVVNAGVDIGATLLIELLDRWIAILPELNAAAFGRAAPQDIARYDAILQTQQEELRGAGDLDRLAELEVELQDLTTSLVGSILVKLLANTSRPLRRRLARLFFETIDAAAHVQMQRGQLGLIVTKSLDPGAIRDRYRAFLAPYLAPLRERIAALPAGPRRRRPSPFPAVPVHLPSSARGLP